MGYFKNIKLNCFRNFNECQLEFSDKCNVFFGKNGCGKTNLLEALSLCTKGRGIRKDKIKNLRRTGLYTGGQYSIENIVFKVLRRNGYLGQLFDLIGRSYDKIMSLSGNFEKKLKIYVHTSEKSENNGFNRLEEEDKYEKRAKSLERRHKRLKTANLGHSVGIKTPNSGPYNEDPELIKAKSAPAGFGGS